jgi:tetratricopeptide (TPR) repeat protein
VHEVKHPDPTAREGLASARGRPAWPVTATLAVISPLVFGTLPTAAVAKCTLVHLPDIPVTMSGLRPMVHAQINGRDALLIADSGAFFSMIAPAAVKEYGLVLNPSIRGLRVGGVGGSEQAEVVRAKTFNILGTQFTDVEFIAAGSVYGNAVGILGQNFLHNWDVEYDLANGVIRLVRPKDCGRDTPLAYWAAAANKVYSAMDIQFASPQTPFTRGVAELDGNRIQVMFDTGAPTSLMTLAAAKRAGITPQSEGVTPGGPVWGFGHRVSQSWIARFRSFKIGDNEEIQNAQLRFGDIELNSADMLVGDDFFLSHRVYVASSQHKLYFTYNGGPVFDLTAHTPAQAAEGGGSGGGTPVAAESGTAPAADQAATSEAAPGTAARLNEPTDAASYARRGAASAARNDYADAIADLTRACELVPTEPDYFYERALAYWHNKQPDLALTDFDQAIKLKPDDVDALLARASLNARRRAAAGQIAADLDAADQALPKEAQQRLRIGELYAFVGQPASAVVQYSKWIDSHPSDDMNAAGALNGRCWARALTGESLDLALADCNAALKTRPNTPAFLDSRGLVYLRQGKYDKAIADYDASLTRRPKNAWTLYGRGLARMHKGLTDAGQTDIAAATALAPDIAARARAFGITP